MSWYWEKWNEVLFVEFENIFFCVHRLFYSGVNALEKISDESRVRCLKTHKPTDFILSLYSQLKGHVEGLPPLLALHRSVKRNLLDLIWVVLVLHSSGNWKPLQGQALFNGLQQQGVPIFLAEYILAPPLSVSASIGHMLLQKKKKVFSRRQSMYLLIVFIREEILCCYSPPQPLPLNFFFRWLLLLMCLNCCAWYLNRYLLKHKRTNYMKGAKSMWLVCDQPSYCLGYCAVVTWGIWDSKYVCCVIAD